jgi:hypothetical protein
MSNVIEYEVNTRDTTPRFPRSGLSAAESTTSFRTLMFEGFESDFVGSIHEAISDLFIGNFFSTGLLEDHGTQNILETFDCNQSNG